MIDNTMCEITQNKLIQKNLVTYIFNTFSVYIGLQNSVIFFKRDTYETRLIIIQQYFALNGQMRILKKWNIDDFQNIVFTHKSNYFITATKSNIFIAQIDCSYNINVEQFIFTQDQRPLKALKQSSKLVLSQNDNLIVASIRAVIYFLIKEDNQIWMLQQKNEIDFGTEAFIDDYKLNDEDNILIISFAQNRKQFLSVFLRVGELWSKIKEFLFRGYPPQFCFLDDQKFLIFDYENYRTKLSEFQIFQKTFKVKQLQTQDTEIMGGFYELIYFAQRGFLVGWKPPSSLYIIQKVNQEFQFFPQMSVSGDLMFRGMANDEWLFFNSTQICGNQYKTQVFKFYGK